MREYKYWVAPEGIEVDDHRDVFTIICGYGAKITIEFNEPIEINGRPVIARSLSINKDGFTIDGLVTVRWGDRTLITCSHPIER